MKTDQTNRRSNIPRLRERLIQAIVQPVPDGLAMCEFECAETECSTEEWKHCKRRREALSTDLSQTRTARSLLPLEASSPAAG